jgi:uncharacterized membrane protein
MKIAAETAPIFSARLKPHRSLTPRGLRLVVAVAAVCSFVPGTIFFLLGAWPVIGFMGLDVLALYWALKHTLNGSGQFEEVVLQRDCLQVRRVLPSGFEAHEDYDPFLVRLVVVRDLNERTTSLKLRSGGLDSEIGAFLDPADRASFARVFGRALRQARRAPAA